VSDALALLPKRAHGAVLVVEEGRPVGVVTEADCAEVDRFAQLGAVMSAQPQTLPDGIGPDEAFDRLAAGRHRLAPGVGAAAWLARSPGRAPCEPACTGRPPTPPGGCASLPRSASPATWPAAPTSCSPRAWTCWCWIRRTATRSGC